MLFPLSKLSKKPFHRTKIGSFVKIALMGHLSNHCEKNVHFFLLKKDTLRSLKRSQLFMTIRGCNKSLNLWQNNNIDLYSMWIKNFLSVSPEKELKIQPKFCIKN